MSIGNASETTIAFIAEATAGTTPATPAFQNLRVTSESLTRDKTLIASTELNANPAVRDLIDNGGTVSGEIGFELSFGASDTDKLLEAALRGTFASNVLKAGSDQDSLTFEVLHETGATDRYFRFTGCRINTLTLNVRAAEIVTGTAAVMGMGHSVGTAIITGATYGAANSNAVMSSADVGSIAVTGVSSPIFYQDLSFTVTNNLRALSAIGNTDSIAIGYGTRSVTGTVNAYFENTELYDRFVAGTETDLTLTLTDGTNNYAVTFPRIKLTSGQVTATGQNNDLMAECAFQAIYDATDATDIKIDNS